jgi:hypothetical protein
VSVNTTVDFILGLLAICHMLENDIMLQIADEDAHSSGVDVGFLVPQCLLLKLSSMHVRIPMYYTDQHNH